MAHHVAELIQRAEAGGESAEGQSARAEAFEAILKFWEKRSVVPVNVDPLKKYQGAIQTLYVLSPEAAPWERSRNSRDRSQSTEHLHDDLMLVSLGNILRDVAKHQPLTKTEELIVEQFLRPDEQELIRLLYDGLERASAGCDDAERSAKPVGLQIRHQLIKRLEALEKNLKMLKADVEQEIEQFGEGREKEASPKQKRKTPTSRNATKPTGVRKKPMEKRW